MNDVFYKPIKKKWAHKMAFGIPPLSTVLSLGGRPNDGSNILDNSPYGNHGAITGATWIRLPSGLWGLSHDGINDVVICGNHSSLNITNNLTVLIWAKVTIPDSDYESLFGKYNTNNLRAWCISSPPVAIGAGKYSVTLSADGTTNNFYRYDSDSNWFDGIWHLYGFTFASGTFIMYVDGVSVPNTVGVSAGTINFLFSTTTNTTVGAVYVADVLSRYSTMQTVLAREINSVYSIAQMLAIYNRERRLFGV